MIANAFLRHTIGLTCLLASIISASVYAIELNGELTQGSLVRGKLPAGSKVWLNEQPVAVNERGYFALGFDRTAELQQQLSWQTPGQSRAHQTLELTKREYDIQRIDGLEQNMVSPPESLQQRIRDDASRVRQARTGKRDLDAFMQTFIWPAEGPITGVYGSQRILNGEPKWPHYGVDVGAPTGTPVVAPASGVVTLADPDLYYSGGTLIIDHGWGVYSTFLHLSELTVKVGDLVRQGDLIGAIGATGRATGPHLDWRINLNEQRLDPALLVPSR